MVFPRQHLACSTATAMFVHESSLRRGINIDELEESGGVVLQEEEAVVPSSHSGTTTAPSSDSGGSLSS